MTKACLQLYFQPKINVTEKTIIGYEVLLRNKEVQPCYPAAKMERVYHDQKKNAVFLKWLQQELDQLFQMYPNISLSINFAPRQLLYPETKLFFQQMRTHAVQLMIEVTEDVPLLELTEENDSQQLEHEIEETLAFIKQQGYAIALDDVGSGQNSLDRALNYVGYLQQIKFSIIKCVHQQASHETIASFLKAWQQFAKENQIDVIIEGIEDQATSDMLKNAGLHLQQGYYFGRPAAELKLQH
ncbi:EAL domain-containing protein [Pisciglobus halotolerans]|uniref:EAL domain, c-di-GMP-specific phosphodiesterase class I (Or its enzymatically inactive variant) n=1 Tax=Pisciglobus halotolerans TaxID=745365 RepID=A0A1I3AYL0_9LACT|nr:EAL domain-containing protein [Pisciglobus halotolerans]SFH54471.1 EAL domain, c-di-GMP-specific phosphodiesterase class I (or its enzymatically inactive variant) [Pisciglobus halotolerans]